MTRDLSEFERILDKIRTKSIRKLIILYYNTHVVSAYLPEEYGGWGLQWREEGQSERITIDSLRRLVQKSFGVVRMSRRSLLDYAYALQALNYIERNL
jgi:hypothetical protein